MCAVFALAFFSFPDAVYLVAILASFLGYFWFTFLGAALAWMVYEVAQGKDTTVASGFKRAAHNLGDILAFAAVVMFIRAVSNWLRQKGMAGQMAGGTLETLAGIAGRLVLPAMIVTERSFGEAVKQLRDSVKAIPEIAAYEIGIRPLVGLAVFIGIGVTAVLAMVMPIFALFFALAYLLLLIMASIYVNNTYYTLLYLTVIEKKKLKEFRL